MRRSKLALTTLGLCLAVIGLGSVASAATPNPGITVTPARLNFSLSKDALSQRMSVQITNNYDRAVTLAAELKGINENAGLLVPNGAAEPEFEDALKLSETSLRLLPHQAHSLTVQLNNTAQLAPGGHYATLVLTQQDGSQPTNGLNLRAAISLSIFAVKTAGERQSLTVSSLHTDGWLFRLPSTASISYQNTGNVHIVPRGVVVVGAVASDNPVRKGISNPNSVLILPGKNWQDQVPLSGLGHVWLPSRQELFVAYRIDGSSKQQTITRHFWYIPPVYPLILLLLVGFFWYSRRQPSAPGKPGPSAAVGLPVSKARKITVSGSHSSDKILVSNQKSRTSETKKS
jgi:hypothetical protein